MMTRPPLGKAGGVAFGSGAAGMKLPPTGPEKIPRLICVVKNRSREPSVPTAVTVIGFKSAPERTEVLTFANVRFEARMLNWFEATTGVVAGGLAFVGALAFRR